MSQCIITSITSITTIISNTNLLRVFLPCIKPPWKDNSPNRFLLFLLKALQRRLCVTVKFIAAHIIHSIALRNNTALHNHIVLHNIASHYFKSVCSTVCFTYFGPEEFLFSESLPGRCCFLFFEGFSLVATKAQHWPPMLLLSCK